jgi:Na+/proline symporter
MNFVTLGIGVYIAGQLLIGLWVSRLVRTDDDYFLGGRKFGYLLATFSIFATWFGAESCIGTAGAAYENGFAGVLADPFGYAVCIALMGLVLAVPLWKMGLTTIADLFRLRYTVRTERTVAILMIPTSLLWAAAQIRALGMVLAASSDIGITVGITTAAAVVIVYTTLGGLLADAITDVVQGVALIIGLICLIPALADVISSNHLTFSTLVIRPNLSSVHWLDIVEGMAIPICGSLVAQELVSRVLASRSPKVAQRSAWFASVIYVVIGLIPLFIGLAAFHSLKDVEHAEQILPFFAQIHLPSWLYVVFAGALVSAILSTVDSALLACSALLSHNILNVKSIVSDRAKLRLDRAGVVIMGILAYVFAIHAEGVYELVKDASSLGSAGIFVVVMVGVFSKWGGERSAMAALIAGLVTWLTATYVFHFDWAYTAAVVVSAFAYGITAMIWERSNRGISIT